ncbi:hypothetical protein [Winogradskyella forsetii]|uniref:hypothetical protein n=1 Tax=Winogradskyella forsetii TaxID=2686077 RepID=UPI0015BB2E75|nr:hypothetical protein [Winogradskyella forsetii]
MKYILTIVGFMFIMFSNAQKVESEGKTYEVKDEKIFLDGKDVTETLTDEEKNFILKEAVVISDKMILEEIKRKEAEEKIKGHNEAAEKLEKEAKKAEKAQKKAEKELKKAEKELKKKEKLQSNFEKAERNLEKSQSKYEKLKRKGKLSPEDERKWLDKLEKLTSKLKKAKGRL